MYDRIMDLSPYFRLFLFSDANQPRVKSIRGILTYQGHLGSGSGIFIPTSL